MSFGLRMSAGTHAAVLVVVDPGEETAVRLT